MLQPGLKGAVLTFIRTYVDDVASLTRSLSEAALTTASHIINDFQKCIPPVGGDRPYRAMALTDNIPLLLAWGNDTEFGNIFSEQLRNWVQPGDVVIGISGSGNSENVIRAIELANLSGAITIGLSAYDGGRLAKAVRYSLHIPTFNMQQAEDLHMIVCHVLFAGLRERLAG
jgi:D-sedoheptulose 7-phosphate isomerase